MTGDYASQVSKVFHCVEVGTIDADMRRTVRFSRMGLVQHLNLSPTDGEAEVLGCVLDNVCPAFPLPTALLPTIRCTVKDGFGMTL